MGDIRRPKHSQEWHIQQALIAYLKIRGWHVERMIGNAFQMGVPDLFIAHPKWGQRWIDVKRPGKNYTFTKAQKLKWPVWEAFGIGIWILTAASARRIRQAVRAAQLARLLEGVVGQDP